MRFNMKVFDGHCDTISRCYAKGDGLRHRTGHLDLGRTQSFEAYAQFFAIFANQEKYTEEDFSTVAQRQYAVFCREMEANADLITHCRTGEAICSAHNGGKMAALLSVEGGELLGCDLAKLEEAYRWGVRAVNLTWNHANALSGSCVEETERGLSPLGRAFVKRMGELGMLVDVSHLSDAGFWDLVECTQQPFFASHSNARTVHYHPRNLTDEQFTAIIDCGGVVGMNMFAKFLGEAPTVDTVIAHIEHFWSLGGTENVALGGDLDGCHELPEGMQDILDYHKLYDRLLQRNYSETLIDGFFYNNLMRVVKKVCTM